MPPKARAKGVAAKAKAKAAFAGKAKAQSAGLTKGTDSPGPRLWPREDGYTAAGMLTITTMKTSHQASKAV